MDKAKGSSPQGAANCLRPCGMRFAILKIPLSLDPHSDPPMTMKGQCVDEKHFPLASHGPGRFGDRPSLGQANRRLIQSASSSKNSPCRNFAFNGLRRM